jgi:3-hydroxyisobutyrate dehydrogenase
VKIGFIGLGTMGKPMARNLAKAGYELIVYNRNREKAQGWPDGAKVQVAGSAAEVAGQADILFTMLTDDAAVEEVYLGKEGLLEGASGRNNPELLVVDCSTIHPDTTLKMAERLASAGIEMLDAPVTGSEPQAEEGVLTFIVGGKPSLYEKCVPLFDVMGKKAVHMGAQGAGAKAKLANNALVATTLIALSESLALVQKSGVDPRLFLEVVAGGGARSGMAEMKGPKILGRDYSPQFMAKLMHKDLKLASRLAESVQVPMPALAAAKQVFQIACNLGLGDEDMSAVAKCYEQWSRIGGQHS